MYDVKLPLVNGNSLTPYPAYPDQGKVHCAYHMSVPRTKQTKTSLSAVKHIDPYAYTNELF